MALNIVPEKPGEIDKMLAAAEKKVYEGDFKQAAGLLDQLLKQQPKHLDALDLYAKGAMDAGMTPLAIKILKKSISIDPRTYHRWMNLGQLQGGLTALKCYRQGIQCMESELSAFKIASDQKQMRQISTEIASAYASIAELYVTDLCDDDGAEKECESALKCAFKASEESAEAHYGAANLRFIQGRKGEAKGHLGKSFEIIKRQAAESHSGSSRDEGGYEHTYNFRLSVTELCIEMGEFEAASELIDRLLEEDNRISRVWYFAALCSFKLDDVESAEQYLERTISFFKKNPSEEPELQGACKELHSAIQNALKQTGNRSSEIAPNSTKSNGAAMMEDD